MNRGEGRVEKWCVFDVVKGSQQQIFGDGDTQFAACADQAPGGSIVRTDNSIDSLADRCIDIV